MVQITFVEPTGSVRAVDAAGGGSLMEAAVAHGVDGIAAECGGGCSCATCHVILADDWIARIGPASGDEDEILEMVARQPGSRLSCQLKVTPALAGLVVTVPPLA